MTNLSLSPAENAFVDTLIEVGDPNAAATIAGVQPSLGRDPRIQSALVDRIREHGALDAVYARKVLRDLAATAENEGVRFRAATALWERGLGKVPDEVKVGITIEHLDRAALYAEIQQLIGELGLPPQLEGEFTLVGPEGDDAPSLDTPSAPPAAAVAPALPTAQGAGSTPAAGTPDPAYIPDIPLKWR